jgi:hypothetical protein
MVFCWIDVFDSCGLLDEWWECCKFVDVHVHTSQELDMDEWWECCKFVDVHTAQELGWVMSTCCPWPAACAAAVLWSRVESRMLWEMIYRQERQPLSLCLKREKRGCQVDPYHLPSTTSPPRLVSCLYHSPQPNIEKYIELPCILKVDD